MIVGKVIAAICGIWFLIGLFAVAIFAVCSWNNSGISRWEESTDICALIKARRKE